jgi:THO complex subunit 2
MNARTFAKICHNAPCIVLNEAVKQLRIYNNIIPSISASLANYSLTLSVEISIFMILRHLSEIGKGIIREDEGLIESWMQNCSNFISLTIKKHHRIDLTGIFVFIANRLASDSDKESVFVVLFKDIITRMSGYESVSSFTQTQLSSLSGGIGLKTEAFGLFEQVRTAKKSSNSLADFLKSQNNHVRVFCDNDVEYTLSLPVYLIILMSRMRDKLVYKSDLSKPTLINMLFDMINESLVQFGLFLSSYPEFFTNRCQLLPDNPWEVMTNLKVSPEIAYQILRYSFKPIYKLEETEWSEVVQKFKSSFDDFPYKTQYIAAAVENDKISSYAEGERAKMWQMMSPELFTLFWYLDSEHLFVPQDAYNTQIADLLKESKSDSKSDKNLDRAKKNIEALKQEMSSKLVEKEKLNRYLQGKKDQLIANFFNSDINIHFYQHCILPRIRLSPSDAIYCVKFINTIMQLKEISPIDQLEIRFNTVKYLYPTVLACSEFEAFNMGIFTEEILDITSNLNDNAKLYSDFKGGKKYDKSQQAEVSKIRYSVLMNYKSLCEVFEASFRDSTFMQVVVY